MTLQQFDLYSKEDQQDYLLKSGTFLDERTEGAFRVMLYELSGFYVEVYFFQRFNKVAFFKAFDNTEDLQPYLNEMDVTDLLQEVFS